MNNASVTPISNEVALVPSNGVPLSWQDSNNAISTTDLQHGNRKLYAMLVAIVDLAVTNGKNNDEIQTLIRTADVDPAVFQKFYLDLTKQRSGYMTPFDTSLSLKSVRTGAAIYIHYKEVNSPILTFIMKRKTLKERYVRCFN